MSLYAIWYDVFLIYFDLYRAVPVHFTQFEEADHDN